MKIGILGYKGRLGSHLVHMGCEPIDYDITSNLSLEGDWDCVINCAAKTQVDECEAKDNKYYWEAVNVNGYGVEKLANNYPNKILHISTDYVFAGKRGPYDEKYWKEDDFPTRNMSYGVTKFLGEINARNAENVHIIRTTGLYGGVSERNTFLNMILDNYGNDVSEMKITKDLMGNQTYIPHLAEALIMCAEREDIPKVLHIASKEVISRYEFALMIASVYGLDKSKFIPVRSEQIPHWVAERPKKGGLKVKLAEKLGLPIYTVLQGLEASKNEEK